MPNDDLPKYRVRVTGHKEVPPRTRVWLPRFGGRYAGHPSAQFGRVTVKRVDFSGVEFDDFDADGTKFKSCDFTRARIEGFLAGGTHQTLFEDCLFDHARLRHARPGQARFVRCTFADTDLWGWSAVATEFVDCTFTGKLRRCKFWGKPWGMWLEPGNLRPARTTNEFRGNDFSAADLEDVGFAGGIDLDQQLLPTGPQYIRLDRAQERIALAKLIVANWDPDEVRTEAILLLDAYSDDEVEFQPELFANRWETDVPREVAIRVWDVLEGLKLS